MISQDTFPGSYIEPEWSRPDKIKKAPLYATMLAFGARSIEKPNCQDGYTAIIFHGIDYVLSIKNYESAEKISHIIKTHFLESRGYTPPFDAVGQNPRVVLDAYLFAESVMSKAATEADEGKTKFLWIVADQSACGYYRSFLPHSHMMNDSDIYTERAEFVNYNTVCWFDAFILHRSPPPNIISLAQNIAASKDKVIVYEHDDDLFNVPQWNHNSSRITREHLMRATMAMEMADIIVGSTQQLCDICADPSKAMLGPNLISKIVFNRMMPCSREVNLEYKGTKAFPVETKESITMKFNKPLKDGSSITLDELPVVIDPVRILWAGSNTHDEDLRELVPGIINLINEYGIVIHFIFFGYCPQEFIETVIDPGNTKPKFVVKPEYACNVSYVEPCHFSKYVEMLYSIDADIAFCALTDDPFNLSKSNLKILEMGAIGLPVIATNIGEYKKFEDRHEQSIAMYQFGDIEFFLKLMRARIDSTGLRQWCGKQIYNAVHQHWSWDSDNENRRLWDAIFDKIKNVSTEKKICQKKITGTDSVSLTQA